MFYLYSVNEGEALVWAEDTLEAATIYNDLFEGTIQTITPLPYETPIYYIKNKETGDGTWAMEALVATDQEISIATTVGILGENMSNE